MSQPAARFLYVGTYERDYPRNALMIAALRAAGYEVREIHAAVWERTRDKTVGFLRPRPLARLSLRLVAVYAALMARMIRELPGADAVVIGYIGQPDMLVLGPIAKLARRRLIFNPLVTLTDTLIDDRRLVAAGSFGAKLISLVDRAALALADLILVDTPENGDYLRQRLGTRSDKIAQLDVGADERVFTPQEAPSSTARESLHVLFYGKLTPLHGIETILRAAKLLEESGTGDPTIAFEIIGGGQLSTAMTKLADQLGLRSVTFTPWVPYEQLPERIAAADVVLGIFGNTEKAGRVVPNKVFQAMAMGAAIVTRDSPAIRRVLSAERSALLVPPDDAIALATAIRRLSDPSLRARLGAGARSSFIATGSLTAQARVLESTLGPLIATTAQRSASLERGQ